MNKGNTSVNPYLSFAGKCEEAMNFYKEALDGELELMRFEGSPVEVSDENKNKILHATLKFGDAVIMGSDNTMSDNFQMGNSFSVSLNEYDLEKAKKYFNTLSEGGFVMMPFEKTFWGAMFGMFTDKFGVSWMINCEMAE